MRQTHERPSGKPGVYDPSWRTWTGRPAPLVREEVLPYRDRPPSPWRTSSKEDGIRDSYRRGVGPDRG